ncbi:hypothetical protein GUITHDRAFT_111910 [Guillardia theta CCMP2712]|uniref:Uncharacterized protein n=1 Tax=Guillardia theta (strain CCMP2712) TaxID=905079 RepID=L1J157_GUITC|nr:hypothetical protein GUITHDRAFT_111910 [Guillardia theta CCMP2712]EKX42057.1 hypothetical protein GUITHDRAFT_111910 [Guillardia theta CCMP2712]|eukprot:XP_005829037.1 hypothetical protein GUITHDRAFT_111910 [Guillardia theta CCMP2712]
MVKDHDANPDEVVVNVEVKEGAAPTTIQDQDDNGGSSALADENEDIVSVQHSGIVEAKLKTRFHESSSKLDRSFFMARLVDGQRRYEQTPVEGGGPIRKPGGAECQRKPGMVCSHDACTSFYGMERAEQAEGPKEDTASPVAKIARDIKADDEAYMKRDEQEKISDDQTSASKADQPSATHEKAAEEARDSEPAELDQGESEAATGQEEEQEMCLPLSFSTAYSNIKEELFGTTEHLQRFKRPVRRAWMKNFIDAKEDHDLYKPGRVRMCNTEVCNVMIVGVILLAGFGLHILLSTLVFPLHVQ